MPIGKEIKKGLKKLRRLLGAEEKAADAPVAPPPAAVPAPPHRFIDVNKMYFKVRQHWFWDEYDAQGWEPDTYEVYRRYLARDITYVDIGAWVGCTIFFAAEIAGVAKILGVEANAKSFELVTENCALNKPTRNARIFNLCITDRDGDRIPFGTETSSASSIRGNQFMVDTVRLETFLRKYGVYDDDMFLKIDIEGAEELIVDDLRALSSKDNISLYLSFHPPFWSEKEKTTGELLDVLYGFKKIQTSDMKTIARERLAEMCLTTETHPEWGTKFGNFFEIVAVNA